MRQTHPQLVLEDAAHNLASIKDVPPDVLPEGRARDILTVMAGGGYDVYAYESGGSGGTWCVWLGPLADAVADHNGRVSIADWCQQCDTLLRLIVHSWPQEGGAA